MSTQASFSYAISCQGTAECSGSESKEFLYGDAQNNNIKGLGGDDTLNGNAGNDSLYGGADNDTLNGNAGNDYLYGGAGIDTLNGNEGNDFLSGLEGNDILVDSQGNNTYWGGKGNDTFKFHLIDGESNSISDYTFTESAERDLIDISESTSAGLDYRNLYFNVTPQGNLGISLVKFYPFGPTNSYFITIYTKSIWINIKHRFAGGVSNKRALVKTGYVYSR